MTDAELRRLAALRLHHQRLVGEPSPDPVAAVRHAVAVQAQDYPGARWALNLRTAGEPHADAIDALLADGRLIRTHVLRPTWHLVAPEDLRWLLALTGPRIRAGMKGRHRQLEIDAGQIDLALRTIEAAVREARPTRAELGERLAAEGLVLNGERLTHFVMIAELEAVIASGGLRGKHHTYALVDDLVPPVAPRDRDEAIRDLAHRYAGSHGPVTPHDLAWWSGLTVTDARKGLADVPGERFGDALYHAPHFEAPTLGSPVMHLLPNYDELTVAYRDHATSIEPGLPGLVRMDGTALMSHHIARDGLVVGGWRRTLEKAGPVFHPEWQRPPSDAERALVEAQWERYRRSLWYPPTRSS